MNPAVSLRAVTTSDDDLLLQIYAGTRAAELAVVPWTDDQKNEFIAMQFAAQRADYETRFPDAEHSIIAVDGAHVGRVWIDRRDDEIRLLDIALLPEHQNRGTGSELLKRLIEEARQAGTPLRHSVYVTNQAALRFYERLGFTVVEDFETYVLMEWSGPADD